MHVSVAQYFHLLAQSHNTQPPIIQQGGPKKWGKKMFYNSSYHGKVGIRGEIKSVHIVRLRMWSKICRNLNEYTFSRPFLTLLN